MMIFLPNTGKNLLSIRIQFFTSTARNRLRNLCKIKLMVNKTCIQVTQIQIETYFENLHEK